MQNPRETLTNAADSAPGVDDGRHRGQHAPPVNSKPGGRRGVWIWVAISLVILAAVLIAKPNTTRDSAQETVGVAQTAAEIEGSRVPGASNPAPTQ